MRETGWGICELQISETVDTGSCGKKPVLKKEALES